MNSSTTEPSLLAIWVYLRWLALYAVSRPYPNAVDWNRVDRSFLLFLIIFQAGVGAKIGLQAPIRIP